MSNTKKAAVRTRAGEVRETGKVGMAGEVGKAGRFAGPGVIAILLAVLLCFTGCGNPAKAVDMELARTQGDVAVRDGEKELTPTEEMKLYSGYQVQTQEGLAWINLDSVKLTKLDQQSEVEVQKTGKELELFVYAGRLFFYVTEPLQEEESLDIRTSGMVVGIRGTCGWVEILDEEHMRVALLEGTVECRAAGADGTEQNVTVAAGESALVSLENGQAQITVEPLAEADIPAFVLEELNEEQQEEFVSSWTTEAEEAQAETGEAQAETGEAQTGNDARTDGGLATAEAMGEETQAEDYSRKETQYGADGSYDVYEYNEVNIIVRTEHYMADGTLSGVSEYDGENDGRWMKDTYYDENGAIYRVMVPDLEYQVDGELRTVSYDGSGAVIGSEIVVYGEDGGFMRSSQYDAEGNLTGYVVWDGESFISYNPDGTPVP